MSEYGTGSATTSSAQIDTNALQPAPGVTGAATFDWEIETVADLRGQTRPAGALMTGVHLGTGCQQVSSVIAPEMAPVTGRRPVPTPDVPGAAPALLARSLTPTYQGDLR